MPRRFVIVCVLMMLILAAAVDAQAAEDVAIDELEYLIPGKPSVDYPVLSSVPKTKFRCSYYEYAGYFADTETDCQVYHVCFPDGRNASTLCVNGTVFNQRRYTCDWWYNVDCGQAPSLYRLNLFRKPPLPAGVRTTPKPRRRPYVRIRPRTGSRARPSTSKPAATSRKTR